MNYYSISYPTRMIQSCLPLYTCSLPSKSVQHAHNLCLRRPWRQLLCLSGTLLYIPSYNTTLLSSSLLGRSVLRQFHRLRLYPLVRIRLRRTRGSKVLRWRISVLIQRRGFRPSAILSLCVLWVWCMRSARSVRVGSLVESEVVLGDLAVAPALGVRYQELGLNVSEIYR
jgi:hypothetical protein